jgi:hypothetical protein
MDFLPWGGAKGPTGTYRGAGHARLGYSDLGLLGHLKGIVDLDAQVASSALCFRA